MLPSRLRVTRAHLGIARNRLRLVRHLIRQMRCVSSASSSGSFGGVHFGPVSRSGSLVSGFDLTPVYSTVACSVKITFSYVSRFVSTFSRSCRSFASFSGLPGACALAIKFGCVPDFVFTFACARSSCSAGSLCADLAFSRILVE